MRAPGISATTVDIRTTVDPISHNDRLEPFAKFSDLLSKARAVLLHGVGRLQSVVNLGRQNKVAFGLRLVLEHLSLFGGKPVAPYEFGQFLVGMVADELGCERNTP
ncbi:hypothetical protein HDU89_007177 [Geranomyces variabilis]|nr:hypothetical protein HDU89_007177 [Geranomyces variabilis]